MSISLYAEFLLHICQATLYATLTTAAPPNDDDNDDDAHGSKDKKEHAGRPNAGLQAHIASDRRTITVTHGAACGRVVFPTGIAGTADVTLPVLASSSSNGGSSSSSSSTAGAGQRQFASLRLAIDEETLTGAGSNDDDDATARTPAARHWAVGNDAPWAAGVLGPATEVACGACEAEAALLPPHRLAEWRDLPRAGWAEVMDLWHCHKPPVDEGADVPPPPPRRDGRYGALEGAALRGDVGLVDACHFLLPEAACVGVMHPLDTPEDVACAACGTVLGARESALACYRLDKWRLRVRRVAEGPWERNDVANFVCAQLLEKMEADGESRFLAYPGELQTATEGLVLWVLIPDLKYSASALADGQPRRAMKILYEKTSKAPCDMLDGKSASLAELPLSTAVYAHVKARLEESTAVLPDSARSLNNWTVGLLDRFDPA